MLPTWPTLAIMANTGHAPRFGQPGGLSVRLFPLIYIRSRHEPRLFGACNTSPPLKVLRPEKQISAFPWIMPRVITSPSARTERRRRQSKKILEEGVEMRPCSACSLQSSRCVASRGSDSCAKCVETGLPCDLVVTAAD